LIPFGLTVVLVVVLRVTVLGKSGHYAGQYAPVHNIHVVMNALLQHLTAFRASLKYAYTWGFQFLGLGASVAITLLFMAGFALLVLEHSGHHGY
jgi:hypothetical protein